MIENTVLNELEERIKSIGGLSKTNQCIADFMVHRLRHTSLMTAQELATEAGVSQASVSRFCRELGYPGFGDFVRDLQDTVREEWQAPDRLKYAKGSKQSPSKNILLEEEIHNIARLGAVFKSDPYKELTRFVVDTPRLILASARASATLIPYAAYFLGKIREHVDIATPDTVLWTTLASRPQPDTGILTLVFPRYASNLMSWIDDVTRWGTPVAAITDRSGSPAVSRALPVVVIPVARSSLFDSYAAPIVFLNHLIRDAAASYPDIETRLKAIELYETSHHTYQR